MANAGKGDISFIALEGATNALEHRSARQDDDGIGDVPPSVQKDGK